MRNTSLSTLKTMLQAAIGDSLVVVNAQTSAIYGQLLADKQQWLAGTFDFPFLKTRWNVQLAPITRYYAIPTTTADGVTNTSIAFERPPRAYVSWTNQWIDVDYGIDEDPEMNQYQSDTNLGGWSQQRNDPVQRWQFYDQTQFEVWPVPNTGQFFRFVGQRALKPLVAPTDTADLDDQLLVESVAVDLLAKKKDASSQSKVATMQSRLRTLLAVYPSRSREVIIGGGSLKRSYRSLHRNVPIVTIKG